MIQLEYYKHTSSVHVLCIPQSSDSNKVYPVPITSKAYSMQVIAPLVRMVVRSQKYAVPIIFMSCNRENIFGIYTF